MPTITEIREKVDLAKNGIEQETAKIIIKFEKEILDLIRENQLYDKGVDGKDKPLKPYTRFTVGYKKIKGQKYSNTTLEDTGSFYKSFQTDYGSFILEVFATDRKLPKLEKKYGKNIIKFNLDSKEKLSSEIIRPNLVNYFRKYFK